MATPSLTNAGLWCDTVTVSSATTLVLKIGIWTEIKANSSGTVFVEFAGGRFLIGGNERAGGGQYGLSPSSPTCAMRII